MSEELRREGIDTTNLQTAWAAIFPNYYGANEMPRYAERCFCEAVNRYVYTDVRLVPLPESELGVTNPLMDLWCRGDGAQFVPEASHYILDEEVRQALIQSLLSDADSIPDAIASWISLQFTPRVSDEYASRAGASGSDPIAPVIEQEDAVRRLLESNSMCTLSDRVQGIQLSPLHEDAARRHCVRPEVYAICYWFSHFVRGRKYAERFRDVDSPYTSHWTRVPALCNPALDSLEGESHHTEVPWGEILFACIQEGFIPRDSQRIIQSIRTIRETCRSAGPDLYDDDDRTRKNARMSVLEKADIFGKYRFTPVHHVLPDKLEDIAKAVPVIGQPFAALFHVIGVLAKHPGVSKLDAKGTRLLMFASYEKSFRVPRVHD